MEQRRHSPAVAVAATAPHIADGVEEAHADSGALPLRHHDEPARARLDQNRTWPTRYRGEFLLHAALTYDTDGHWALEREFGLVLPPMSEMPGGGIVGRARLVDCVTHSESRWFNGPYGFVLADSTPLPFLPCRGALGFFEITDRNFEHSNGR